jgi:hypothetical protein
MLRSKTDLDLGLWEPAPRPQIMGWRTVNNFDYVIIRDVSGQCFHRLWKPLHLSSLERNLLNHFLRYRARYDAREVKVLEVLPKKQIRFRLPHWPYSDSEVWPFRFLVRFIEEVDGAAVAMRVVFQVENRRFIW